MAARILSGRAPSSIIARTVASSTPPFAPFQPACAAPITLASGSTSSTGAQSAVSTPRAMPGTEVTMASAFGPSPGAQTSCTVTASAL